MDSNSVVLPQPDGPFNQDHITWRYVAPEIVYGDSANVRRGDVECLLYCVGSECPPHTA